MSFWNFQPHEKWDEVIEGRHDHLYYGALSDSQTNVERVGRDTYIIYGPVEALLMRPVGFIYRTGLDLLEAFVGLIHE